MGDKLFSPTNNLLLGNNCPDTSSQKPINNSNLQKTLAGRDRDKSKYVGFRDYYDTLSSFQAPSSIPTVRTANTYWGFINNAGNDLRQGLPKHVLNPVKGRVGNDPLKKIVY